MKEVSGSPRDSGVLPWRRRGCQRGCQPCLQPGLWFLLLICRKAACTHSLPPQLWGLTPSSSPREECMTSTLWPCALWGSVWEAGCC